MAAVLAVTPALAGKPELHTLPRPLPADEGGSIAAMEVRETLAGRQLAPGETLLELAHLRFNVPSAADRVQPLAARD